MSSFDGQTDLVLVDHEFVNFDGRLLPVLLLHVLDRVTKHLQFRVTFTMRSQTVLKHLLTYRSELLLIRMNSNVKKYKCPCYYYYYIIIIIIM